MKRFVTLLILLAILTAGCSEAKKTTTPAASKSTPAKTTGTKAAPAETSKPAK